MHPAVAFAIVVSFFAIGEFVAAYEMSSRALAQNRQDLSNLALLVLALQSFPAFLIAPSLLKKEANRLLKPFREGKMSLSESEEKIKKRKSSHLFQKSIILIQLF